MFVYDETGHRLWLIYYRRYEKGKAEKAGQSVCVNDLSPQRLKTVSPFCLFAYIIIAIILPLTIHHN